MLILQTRYTKALVGGPRAEQKRNAAAVLTNTMFVYSELK